MEMKSEKPCEDDYIFIFIFIKLNACILFINVSHFNITHRSSNINKLNNTNKLYCITYSSYFTFSLNFFLLPSQICAFLPINLLFHKFLYCSIILMLKLFNNKIESYKLNTSTSSLVFYYF